MLTVWLKSRNKWAKSIKDYNSSSYLYRSHSTNVTKTKPSNKTIVIPTKWTWLSKSKKTPIINSDFDFINNIILLIYIYIYIYSINIK